MKPMQMLTPEQRREVVAKGHETRRRRKAERQAAEQQLSEHASKLRNEVMQLERRLKSLTAMEVMGQAAHRLTGKMLLREEEIAAASSPWQRACGVYFLLCAGRVVYVGQSRNVYGRIEQHREKVFDSFAFVPCKPEALDALESLYIHALRPALNGCLPDGAKMAPLHLHRLLEVVSD